MKKKKEVVVPVITDKPSNVYRQYLTKEELLGMIDRIHAKQKKEKDK